MVSGFWVLFLCKFFFPSHLENCTILFWELNFPVIEFFKNQNQRVPIIFFPILFSFFIFPFFFSCTSFLFLAIFCPNCGGEPVLSYRKPIERHVEDLSCTCLSALQCRRNSGVMGMQWYFGRVDHPGCRPLFSAGCSAVPNSPISPFFGHFNNYYAL